MRAPASFAEYASSPDLSRDEIHTVEMLMEQVRYELQGPYARAWMERSDARKLEDYVPSYPHELVGQAAKALSKVTSLFLPTQWGDVHFIKDITALRWMPHLESIVLSGHQIPDIGPLCFCVNLERLELPMHPVKDLSPLSECRKLKKLELPGGSFADLSPLAGCRDLEELRIWGKVDDLSVLTAFPKLWRLTLDSESLPAFRRLVELPFVTELNLACSGNFDSFEGFPAMPALQILTGASVAGLHGIEKYPSLRNLMALSGTFHSLEPLRQLGASPTCRFRKVL